MGYMEVWVDDPPLDEAAVSELEDIIRDLDSCLNVANPNVREMQLLVNAARRLLNIEIKVPSKGPLVRVRPA